MCHAMELIEICLFAKVSVTVFGAGMGIDDITGLAEVRRIPFCGLQAPVCCRGTHDIIERSAESPSRSTKDS